jgi:hypothetical protein
LNADQHPKHLSTIGIVEWTLFSQAIVFGFATKFLLFGISAVETRWAALSCGGSGSIPIVAARWVLALGSGSSFPTILIVSGLTALFLNAL